MVVRIFTFGMGETLQGGPADGRPLADHYVAIEAETSEHARCIMLNHFGQNWAFTYDSLEKAQAPWAPKMIQLPPELWPPDSGRYRIRLVSDRMTPLIEYREGSWG